MLRNIILSFALPLLAFGVEFISSGGFEQPYKEEFHVRRVLRDADGKILPIPDGVITDRVQRERVYSGKYALLMESKEGGHEINTNRKVIKVIPGAKYQFSFRYFIVAKGPKTRVSGRIMFNFDNAKNRYIFPEGDGTPGKWQQLKIQFYPPPETKAISATLWFSNGPYKIVVDEIQVGTVTETQEYDPAVNACLLMSTPELDLWQQANFRRVDAVGRPEGLKKQSEVELTAAANEREPFQLVVTPKETLEKLTLRISDLKGSAGVIPSGLQSYGVISYVPVREPNNPTIKGEIGDPVLPGGEQIAAPAGKNTAFYVKIFAPKGTAPGVYTGTVSLYDGDKELAGVPVKLRVRNFTLPDDPVFRTLFYGHPYAIKKFFSDPRSFREIADDVSEIFKEHRLDGNQCIKPPVPKYTIEGDKLTVTDWSEFDAFVWRQYNTFGIRNFTVPVLGMMGDNSGWFSKGKPKVFGESLFSERGRMLAGQYAQQYDEHWRKSFPQKLKYYCYIYDEPAPKVYAELNKFTGAIKKYAPDFRFFTPHMADPELPDFEIFAVPFAFGYVKPELQKGLEIWYYNWPHPLDHHNYINNRLYAWKIIANGGEGGLTWQVADVRDGKSNPWTDLEKCSKDGNNLNLYPARTPGGKLVPSLRLAQVREAVDDVDYMKILEQTVDSRFPGAGKNRVAEVLKEILPELPFGYVNDGNLLYRLRAKIGDEIEDFLREPVALVESNPVENTETELSLVIFTVHGPDGAQISIDGLNLGVIHDRKLTFERMLDRIGENRIVIKVSHQGKSREIIRRFILKRDANLDKLTKAVGDLIKYGLSTQVEAAFLKACAAGPYSGEDRKRCSELLLGAEKRLLEARLNNVTGNAEPLSQAVFRQAKWMYDNNLYARAGYYLDMLESLKESTLTPAGPLKIEPVDLFGNFGFKISNGKIEFTLLELGGRVVSFKVNGVETLFAGDLQKTLPLNIRAGKLYQSFTHRSIPSLGGFEDAGLEVLPESAVDWDLTFKELSPERIAIEASMLLRGDKFRISRVMSIVPDSMELKFDYTISNVYPPEFKSDDPSHYLFPWRGRLMPAIGDNRQLDTIEVPTKLELETSVFDMNNPVFYEMRSVPLTESRMGVFNPVKKTGFMWKFDNQINFAYLWMNSKGNHLGGGKVYTLEIFRSFYGNKPGVPGNSPFTINPGESVNFSMSLTGRIGE